MGNKQPGRQDGFGDKTRKYNIELGAGRTIKYNIHFGTCRTRFVVEEKYEFRHVLGWGTYGYVCAFKDKSRHPGKDEVAIKKIIGVFSRSTVIAERLLRELRILRQIRHPFIVQMTGVLIPRDSKRFDEVYVVYEKMDTTLYQILKDRTAKSGPNPSFYKRVMYQVLTALQYLHQANVLHRDLSPSNILLSKCRESAKICDFGLARTFSEEMTHFVVTAAYRAPELFCSNFMIESCRYTSAIDIWALGCIFAEMLRPVTGGKPLFQLSDEPESELKQLHKILKVIPKPSPDDTLEFIEFERNRRYFRKHFGNCHPQTPLRALLHGAEDDAIDLIERMLTFNPSKRITAREALGHPYFKDLAAQDYMCAVINNVTIEDIDEEEIKGKDIDQLRNLLYQEIISVNEGYSLRKRPARAGARVNTKAL